MPRPFPSQVRSPSRRPDRTALCVLVLLCAAAVLALGLSRRRDNRPLSMRLWQLKFHAAELLMERWADEPQRHPRWTPWLDRNAQLERYRDADRALPATSPGRIVLYGDSLTDYWLPRSPETFLPGRPAVDRGIAGQATPELLWRLRQDALDLHPGILVLLAGTNDIVAPGLHISPAEIHRNLTRMVALARQRGIRVVLCSLPPVAFRDPKLQRLFTPQIEALNAWLQTYAATQRLTYVDYFTALAAPDRSLPAALRTDQLHPNPAGYRIMQHTLEQALDKQP